MQQMLKPSPSGRLHGVASLPQRPALSLRYRMKHCTRAAAAIELPNKFSKARGYISRYPRENQPGYSVGKTLLIFLQVSPKGDLVLCKVAEAEEQTTGGLLLPSSAQSKPTSGKYPCWPPFLQTAPTFTCMSQVTLWHLVMVEWEAMFRPLIFKLGRQWCTANLASARRIWTSKGKDTQCCEKTTV